MDAVGSPEGFFTFAGCGGENAVERNQHIGELFGEIADHLDLDVQIIAPQTAVLGNRQQEGFHHHDLHAGKIMNGFFQNEAVVSFKRIRRRRAVAVVAAPHVVDADQDRDHVRLVVDDVLLPALPEIADPVAGNSRIDKRKLQFRHVRTEERGNEDRITVTEEVDVFTGGASAVRDAVADEKNFLAVFNSEHRSSSCLILSIAQSSAEYAFLQADLREYFKFYGV